jgi:hypothetical protein
MAFNDRRDAAIYDRRGDFLDDDNEHRRDALQQYNFFGQPINGGNEWEDRGLDPRYAATEAQRVQGATAKHRDAAKINHFAFILHNGVLLLARRSELETRCELLGAGAYDPAALLRAIQRLAPNKDNALYLLALETPCPVSRPGVEAFEARIILDDSAPVLTADGWVSVGNEWLVKAWAEIGATDGFYGDLDCLVGLDARTHLALAYGVLMKASGRNARAKRRRGYVG